MTTTTNRTKIAKSNNNIWGGMRKQEVHENDDSGAAPDRCDDGYFGFGDGENFS